ncbi:hypothetical protein [Phenylobacterium sp.]|uniref:hypothetical protein n=1 Tax=Phenylobacterium sp. TaxID=1871053 RepID=UPI0040356FEE
MRQVQPGDIFKEASSAARHWRIVAVRTGAYELECVGAPNLSRFATHEKLFDTNHYYPDRSVGSEVDE